MVSYSVEQLGSRLFLLSLLPQLQTFSSPLSSTPRGSSSSFSQRFVALDVGAGVGRVTAETLLPLVDDVITIEPVKHFIEQARKDSSSWKHFQPKGKNKSTDQFSDDEDVGTGDLGNQGGKRVWFIQAPLNDLDPSRPSSGNLAQSLGVYGGKGADGSFGERAGDIYYDV